MSQEPILPKTIGDDSSRKENEEDSGFLKSFLRALLYMAVGAAISILLTDNRLQDIIRLPPITTFLNADLPPQSGQNYSYLFQLPVQETEHIRFLPKEKLLVAVTAKAGSTTFWKWLFTGVTGKQEFNCSSYVQNVRAQCWDKRAIELHDLPPEVREFALTSPKVLRVAVWRDPFSRLVSCWKSKFACEAWKYGTDYPDRERMVPQLRHSAGLPDVPCLNISMYADTLEAVRLRVLSGNVPLKELNPHLRPQEFFFNDIKYNMILDVTELSDAKKVYRVWKRLPHRHEVQRRMEHLHKSTGESIAIPEKAAELIGRFASLTKPKPDDILVRR